MVSTPAAAPAPAPPSVPQGGPPVPGLTRARWLYVDHERTHEVLAGLRPGAGGGREFLAREGPYQNADPAEFYEEIHKLEAPWEAQLFQWRLECRLARVGKYWKFDTANPGWRELLLPQGAPDLDLREVRVADPQRRVVFYHFHHPRAKDDRVLVAIPREHASGARWLLAEARFTFPNAEDGEIALVHAHLAERAAKSRIVGSHMALKDEGYEKLVGGQDYLRVHGKDWELEAATVFRDVLLRIAEGRFGSGKRPAAEIVDSFYTDFFSALTDPRVIALHARYLEEGEEAKLLSMGEPAIQRAIARKRLTTPLDEQHFLTILEASLIARDQLGPQQRRVDPEVAALVRRFAYYL